MTALTPTRLHGTAPEPRTLDRSERQRAHVRTPSKLLGAYRASCRGCTRKWVHLREAHCAACHRHFATTNGFDKHRTGSECRDPQTLFSRNGTSILVLRMKTSGLTWVGYRNPDSYPISWQHDDDDEEDA